VYIEIRFPIWVVAY